MIYRIVIEPTAEREIRSTVRWKTESASPTVAALVQRPDPEGQHPPPPSDSMPIGR